MTKFNKKEEGSMGIVGIQFLEILLVIFSLVLSFALAGFFIYGEYFPFGIQQGVFLSALVSAMAVIILASFQYFNFMSCTFTSTMGKSISIVLSINVILIIFLYFITESKLSLYYFIVAMALQYSSLLMIKLFSSGLKRKILQGKRALVIGKSKDKEWMLETVGKQWEYKLAFLDETARNFMSAIDRSDCIYLLSSATREYKRRIITYCELQGKKLFIVPEVHEIAMRDSELSRIGDIPLFTIDQFRMTEGQAMVKRAIDFFGAAIGVVVTAPILLISAMLIKSEDGGPVFYRQIRSGINGKEFEIWKLRSMEVDAEKTTGSVFASENDPRITRIGRILRSSRIDEIPQFFNVLEGSMSLVGPRPERPCFVEKFCNDNPEYNLRLAVKPGITGLAQVMANYTTTAENKLKFDLFYIKSYSPLLDFHIMMKTVQIVFHKSHAAGFKEEKETDLNISSPLQIEVFEDSENEEFCSSRRKRRQYNWLKALLTVTACGVIIISTIFVRYSPLVNQLNQMMVSENQRIHSIEETPVPMSSESAVSFVVAAGVPVQEDKLEPLGIGEYWNLLIGLVLRLEPSELAELEAMAEGGFTKEERIRAEELLRVYW